MIGGVTKRDSKDAPTTGRWICLSQTRKQTRKTHRNTDTPPGVHLYLRPPRLARSIGVSFEIVERRRRSISVRGL